MKKSLIISAILSSIFIVSGCQSTSNTSASHSNIEAQPVLKSEINLVGNDSVQLGEMYLRPVQDGIQVYGQLVGLKPGATVAVHIHETGSCANMGKAAGGHFNPYNKPHGNPNSAQSHAGDLPNITADATGVATINFVRPDISVAMAADNSVYRRAFIVHGGVDDYTSQPSGNAGDRIACGIIETI